MLAYISQVLSWLAGRFRSRAELALEVIAIRHQLAVLHRQRPGRTRLSPLDRLLWIWLYRVWPRCLNIMVLVKPATVVQWHRQVFRLYWRRRSRSGRPSVGREVRDLIRQMNSEVVTAPRSPWQNAYVQRVIGSIRGRRPDHRAIFNQRYLGPLLSSYVDYSHRARPHLSLDKDCPHSRPTQPPRSGQVI